MCSEGSGSMPGVCVSPSHVSTPTTGPTCQMLRGPIRGHIKSRLSAVVPSVHGRYQRTTGENFLAFCYSVVISRDDRMGNWQRSDVTATAVLLRTLRLRWNCVETSSDLCDICAIIMGTEIYGRVSIGFPCIRSHKRRFGVLECYLRTHICGFSSGNRGLPQALSWSISKRRLIRMFAFVRNWRGNGSTVRQYISYS
jgi:hypothetical protein